MSFFVEQGIITKDGNAHDFDAVILATGYRANIDEFIPNIDRFLDKYGIPRQVIGEGEFEGLFFVGFDNYKLGGILGTIITDSETILKHIQQQQTV